MGAGREEMHDLIRETYYTIVSNYLVTSLLTTLANSRANSIREFARDERRSFSLLLHHFILLTKTW